VKPFGLPRGLRPRRTIQPTREGWWCLLAAVALGLTAINSGNNLLYLLESALLGLVIVSGILSELSMRRIQLAPLLPEEIYAGRPAVLGARVVNAKRRLPARSIVLEVADSGRLLPLPRLGPGRERVVTWEHTFARRGRQRLGGVRVTTRFPFGLFVKAGPRQLETDVLVFPAVDAIALERPGPAAGEEAVAIRRRGRGTDLYNVRDYRDGDDPRLIHWRLSAKTGTTMIRELQADSTTDVRITLRTSGSGDAVRLERGLSRAASLAVHYLRAGVAVSLAGPGMLVPRDRGRAHARRILTALAVYEPSAAAGKGYVDGVPAGREIDVELD
jgi:uncharacterized protein (DUF58 family)